MFIASADRISILLLITITFFFKFFFFRDCLIAIEAIVTVNNVFVSVGRFFHLKIDIVVYADRSYWFFFLLLLVIIGVSAGFHFFRYFI